MSYIYAYSSRIQSALRHRPDPVSRENREASSGRPLIAHNAPPPAVPLSMNDPLAKRNRSGDRAPRPRIRDNPGANPGSAREVAGRSGRCRGPNGGACLIRPYGTSPNRPIRGPGSMGQSKAPATPQASTGLRTARQPRCRTWGSISAAWRARVGLHSFPCSMGALRSLDETR